MEDNSGFKILTIDDEFYIRQSIRSYLEDYGFIVFEAENGQNGLEVFDRENPDLVLLDLRMPEMGGLEVLEILKAKAPDIPLVVASGTGNISAVVEALHLGAWDYILKPIEDMSVLYHSVQKCLKASQLKKENKQYQERLEELVKERTHELQQSEERYKAIFEYTGTAAIIIEPDDTISMVNSKFCEFAGMDSPDIAGRKKWVDFVAAEDIEVIRNYIDAKVNLEIDDYAPMQYEIKFIGNNEEKKYVYVSLGVIPGTDRAVVSLLDVTEKKKAEKRWHSLEKQLRKAQKMEAIGTLAGGIAHDLNNILSPVLGYADMIMQSSDPEANVYKRSEKIQKAALRAADLVSQILSFNRRGEEEKRRIRIHPVSKEVIKLLKGSIPSTITIVDNIDRNCGSVEADPTQIHQVIMNLCTNAYHAMEQTGGTLTVGLKEITLTGTDMLEYPNLTGGKGVYLSIEVSDTGSGMSEDVVDRIFDPYFTTKGEGKGTGLGLATAYSIVRSCKGDIRVKTKPDKGTTFTILLPVVDTENNMDNRESTAKSFKVGSGERLLMVDDDKDIARMCKEGFEFLGYNVELFFSSLEALDFFKENYHTIDLVVTDQTMPGKTGLDLAKDMLAIKKDIPIILCSGYTGMINKMKIKEAGIKSFIMKPVTVGDLSNEIQKILKQ
ncbi:MAG: response regulator [Desulfobacula sp.]|uniref:response regulator n=1 Tax=Desulfobacula sp. TaxID=2593537 RepID=UPI0025BF808D|nr:response regulator [Desulfobacula sp.]MCD4719864.1 response regulator [Desulfobacula sp.]